MGFARTIPLHFHLPFHALRNCQMEQASLEVLLVPVAPINMRCWLTN
jgi:hypothetical protein